MSQIKKQFGKKLKYYREMNGLTQEELAEKLDLNSRSLSFIECGTNFVTADTIEKVCKMLKITPKQLFDFEYYPENPSDVKKEILALIDDNSEKISDVYKILKGFLT